MVRKIGIITSGGDCPGLNAAIRAVGKAGQDMYGLQLTGLESRLTILGHLQRGGSPSAADRVLATRLGTTCAELLCAKKYGAMVVIRGNAIETVPLEKVAGSKKLVPMDHVWVRAAREVGTSFGET